MDSASFRPNGKTILNFMSIFVPKRDFLVHFRVGQICCIGTGSRWLIGTLALFVGLRSLGPIGPVGPVGGLRPPAPPCIS